MGWAAEVMDPRVGNLHNSLNSRSVPEDWKVGRVIPLFKKGRKTDGRQIGTSCLTSIVGKMVQSLIKNEITNHLQKQNMIKSNQHGFMKVKLCLTKCT